MDAKEFFKRACGRNYPYPEENLSTYDYVELVLLFFRCLTSAQIYLVMDGEVSYSSLSVIISRGANRRFRPLQKVSYASRKICYYLSDSRRNQLVDKLFPEGDVYHLSDNYIHTRVHDVANSDALITLFLSGMPISYFRLRAWFTEADTLDGSLFEGRNTDPGSFVPDATIRFGNGDYCLVETDMGTETMSFKNKLGTYGNIISHYPPEDARRVTMLMVAHDGVCGILTPAEQYKELYASYPGIRKRLYALLRKTDTEDIRELSEEEVGSDRQLRGLLNWVRNEYPDVSGVDEITRLIDSRRHQLSEGGDQRLQKDGSCLRPPMSAAVDKRMRDIIRFASIEDSSNPKLSYARDGLRRSFLAGFRLLVLSKRDMGADAIRQMFPRVTGETSGLWDICRNTINNLYHISNMSQRTKGEIDIVIGGKSIYFPLAAVMGQQLPVILEDLEHDVGAWFRVITYLSERNLFDFESGSWMLAYAPISVGTRLAADMIKRRPRIFREMFLYRNGTIRLHPSIAGGFCFVDENGYPYAFNDALEPVHLLL